MGVTWLLSYCFVAVNTVHTGRRPDPRLDPGPQGCFPIRTSSFRLTVGCQGNGVVCQWWDPMWITGMELHWQDRPALTQSPSFGWPWGKGTNGPTAGCEWMLARWRPGQPAVGLVGRWVGRRMV